MILKGHVTGTAGGKAQITSVKNYRLITARLILFSTTLIYTVS